MDHVLEGMQAHYEVTLDWFIKDQKSGKYAKIQDNPGYEEIQALIKSMNVLRKYLEWDMISLSKELKLKGVK